MIELQRASTHHCKKIFIMHILTVEQYSGHIESIVAAAGEHIRPYLAYLPGLIDLLGRIGLYATLWIDL